MLGWDLPGLKDRGGKLVVKWVRWEFSKIGTGGNISQGDHLSLPNKSQDASSTLFVTGVGLDYSMSCFEKPLNDPVYDPFSVVCGLIIQGGLYLGISTEFP